MLENFVVCSIITTGSNPLKDEIIETGLVRVSNSKIVEAVSYYSKPVRKLPVRVKNMTGLSDEFFADKPFFTELLPEVLGFIGDASLVSYEADSVYIFFSAAAGHPLPNLCLDALQLAQILLPTLVNYRLITLYEYLCTEEPCLEESCLEKSCLEDPCLVDPCLVDPCSALPKGALLSAKEMASLTTRVFLKICEGFKELEPDLLAKLNIILNKTSENALINFIKVLTAGVIKNYFSGGQGMEGNSLKDEVFFEDEQGLFFEQVEETLQMYVSQLSQKRIIDILGPGGELAKQHPYYEYRPQQLEMSVAVAQTLNHESLLLTEAGTGTGKSMAYLVPAVLWSVQNQKRVVVSTHTINLQEQLWFKDIPMLKQMLGRTFRAALFKGRQNYLCFSRWNEVLSAADSQDRREALFYSRILVWLTKTQTGDRSEINLNGSEYDYWSKISADSDSCKGNQCRWFQRSCFVSSAKKKAENSDLIIINHSLLCSDLQAENRILPSYGPLIIDEAHHLESVATEHFGYMVSETTIKRWLNSSDKLIQKLGQAPAGDESSSWDQLIYTVRKAIEDIRQAAKVYFNLLKTERCLSDFSEDLPELAAMKNVAGTHVKRMYKENDPSEPNRLIEEGNLLTNSKILLAAMRKIMMRLEIWAAQYEKWVKTAKTFSLHLNMGTQLLTSIDFILSHNDQNFVYWMEKNFFQNNYYITLRAVPIDTGKLLYEKLFASPKAVIFTSATLAIAGSFDYFKERTGLHLYTEEIRQLQIDSPFNYAKQAKLFLASDLPNQNEVPEQFYHTELANIIEKLVNVSQGRTLVLFTSHYSLKQTYLRLKPVFEEMEILLLGHNIDGSRSALIEEFIRNKKAVLFGTASFWEGIDIPGDSLSSVIIVKLPFWSPSIPIIEARLENMVKQGKNSFWEFSLPQAVIRFKQGFGRLIRSSRDHGAVVVLDKRIIQKKYGRYFLNSLPLKHHNRCDMESLLLQINNWLEKKN